MDSQVNYIRQRLSLRKPLAKALELTARLTDKLSLQKSPSRNICAHGFINETFRVLKEREIREYGEYRTKRLVLKAWKHLYSSRRVQTKFITQNN